MELPKQELVDLVIEHVHYRVVIEAVEHTNECRCRITGGNPAELSTLRQRAEISFVRDGQRLFCWGEAFCTHPSVVVFIAKTPVLPERRRAHRFEMPLLPAHIREQHPLCRWRPATIWELSRIGVKFATRHPLEIRKSFVLEIGLGLLNSPDFIGPVQDTAYYPTVVTLHRSTAEGGEYFYGATLARTSPAYEATLGRLIHNLEMERESQKKS